jgi:hypothetical protein
MKRETRKRVKCEGKGKRGHIKGELKLKGFNICCRYEYKSGKKVSSIIVADLDPNQFGPRIRIRL